MKLEICAHCDWSKDHGKRWMASATRTVSGWTLAAPELAGSTGTLLERLSAPVGAAGSVLVGFDFPIGLPNAYAREAGFSSFREAIALFGKGDWSEWYSVADHREQISHRRPFYPMRPGGTLRSHLHDALGIGNGLDLLRECEKSTALRQAGCSLFWTLGGNQVGKGAITGWQEVIAPRLDDVAIWPFDGTLFELTSSKPIIICETYPGDVYSQLGIPRGGWSKKRHSDRQRVAANILAWASERPDIDIDAVVSGLADGFGSGGSGEDRFDAVVGLLGMLDVVTNRRVECLPAEGDTRSIEGWILGHHR